MKVFARWLLVPVLVLMTQLPAYAETEVPAYTQAELDQMLAPIALYPDSLLSQILMAATYPLEVVQAARWSRDNPGLDGESAVAAAESEDWDPSVKALVAFPHVLGRMDENLRWTQDLGEAFLYQEAAVMATVQDLRERAYAAGHLDSIDYVRVYREPEVILIEPAHSHVVFVPYYDPLLVYGNWWWPAYPPVHWAPPRHHFAHTGFFYWGSGTHISTRFFFSSFDWHRRHAVVLDFHKHKPKPYYRPGKHYAKRDGYQRWRHEPGHRRGVAYRNHKLQHQYARHASFDRRPDKHHRVGSHDRKHDRKELDRDHDRRNLATRRFAGSDDRHRFSRDDDTRRRQDDRRNLSGLTPHARRSVLQTRERMSGIRDSRDKRDMHDRARQHSRDHETRHYADRRWREQQANGRVGRERIDSSRGRVEANRTIQRERIDSSRSRVRANRDMGQTRQLRPSRPDIRSQRSIPSRPDVRSQRSVSPARHSVGPSRSGSGNRHSFGNRGGGGKGQSFSRGNGVMR